MVSGLEKERCCVKSNLFIKRDPLPKEGEGGVLGIDWFVTLTENLLIFLPHICPCASSNMIPSRGLVHDWVGEQPVEVGFVSSQPVPVGEHGDRVVRIDDEGDEPVGSPHAATKGELDDVVDGRGRGGVCHNGDQSTGSLLCRQQKVIVFTNF